MISSAVVIPDESQTQSPNQVQSAPLKRRRSSTSESLESSKHPRLDTRPSSVLNNGATPPISPQAARNQASPTTPAASATVGQAMSPPLRRPTVNVDEKSRNRRLFGALLGNLAQANARPKPSSSTSSNTTATRRREEIESRQRQRLQRESEEISQHARRKKEELDRARKVEQRRWDEQGMKTRHTNMRATAGFLRTKTEPRLYYKPWEMKREEEETVRRQREDVEETIRREKEEWERKYRDLEDKEAEKERRIDRPIADRRSHERTEKDRDTNGITGTSRTVSEEASTDGGLNGGIASDDQVIGEQHDRPTSPSSVEQNGKEASNSPARSRTEGSRTTESGRERPQSSKDDDHGGEELELGQEDDVIY